MSPLALTIPGNGPLVINIPHAGTGLIPGLSARLTPEARTLPDTDWHLPFLMHFAAFCGATLIAATHSRYVVDLNRDGRPLYDGDPDPGVCPSRRFDGGPVFAPGAEPTAEEIEARHARYWQPYHDDLAQHLDDTVRRCGHAVLLDVHSIRRQLPERLAEPYPDLALATRNGTSCAPALLAEVGQWLAGTGLRHRLDVPFPGGYAIAEQGRPEAGRHALQIEIAQDLYMNPDDPAGWLPCHARAQALLPKLAALIERLRHWTP